ncbi:MAG: hypothetical protein ABFD79_12405 [Phycisphaerales bacterium]
MNQQIQNEGFSLLRLCADLEDFLINGRSKNTYLKETDEFLNYIKSSLAAVNNHIRKMIASDIKDELIKSKLRELGEIRKVISWLYIFTKQTIDSDSLSIPFSLATFINSLTRKLQNSEEVSLVVLSTGNLNYYKLHLLDFRNLADSLSTCIENYPLLKKDLGILMFPYCAVREVLMNCSLFHEMGHYFYENSKIGIKIAARIENDFFNFINKTQMVAKLNLPLVTGKDLLVYVCQLLRTWADEIFADIFAIRILGPAFHLAYLEIEQLLPINIGENRSFSNTHPADYFRFNMHAKWLNEGGWDNILEEHVPEVYEKLKECRKLQINHKDFRISCKPPLENNLDLEKELHEWMLEEFEEVIIEIEKQIHELFTNFEKPFDDFVNNDKLVREYLTHGVIPSTVYNDNGEKFTPCPTTILNSGFFFYLNEMQRLLRMIVTKKEINEIDKRMHWEKRLNEWLGKAIEDWQILGEKH